LFTICIETCFSASHQLTLTDGSKEPLHRHKWLVKAGVSSDSLNNMGLVIDFRRLKTMVNSVVCVFGNNRLETLDCFQRNNSSAENVAKYIYDKLEPKLPEGVKLDFVSAMEKGACTATFSK